jgi:hypothetical protein
MPTLADLLKTQRPSMVGMVGNSQPIRTLANTIQGYTPPQMTAFTNPQVMDYAKGVGQSAQQNLQTQISDLNKALVMGDKGVEIGDKIALTRLLDQIPGLMGAVAYHGTPHTIRGKFDISKVGTGEGGQAYGHGMYFAENPEVAKTYANLGTGNVAYRGHTEDVLNKLQKSGLDRETADLVSTFAYEGGFKGGTAQDLAAFLKTYADNPSQEKIFTNLTKKPEIVDAINLYVSPKQGNLYKVDIPDEYIPNMLQWDKPLNQQPKAVQKALAKIDPDLYSKKGMDYDPQETGQMIYQRLSQMDMNKNGPFTGASKNVSNMLNAQGIRGIRYSDAGSRGAEGGTSNFVVFEPSNVKILEQNSKPLTRKEILEQELKKVVE